MTNKAQATTPKLCFPSRKISGVRKTSSTHDPVSMNAWRRLWAAWVSLGFPDIMKTRSVVPGRGSCTITFAPEICLKRARLLPFSPKTEPITFSGTTISTVVFVTTADLFPLQNTQKEEEREMLSIKYK